MLIPKVHNLHNLITLHKFLLYIIYRPNIQFEFTIVLRIKLTLSINNVFNIFINFHLNI